MDSLLRSIFPFIVPAMLSLVGCSSRATMDPATLAKFRAQLTLAKEPAGAQTVSQVRTVMLGEAPPDILALLEEDPDHDHADAAGAGNEHTAKHDHEAEGETNHKAHGEDDHDEPAAHADLEEMDVVLIGVVGGIPNPSEQSNPEFPFSPGQAMFFLADSEAVAKLEEHGHHHAPGEECAFCAAHAADATALVAAVQFADEHGKVLPVDARDLFDLQENQTVVVTGKARVKSGGIMMVDATGLFARR